MSTVLVVDDLAVNRDLVQAVLGHYGHNTIEASGATEALRVLAHAHPDLVLSDVLMPGMSGFELARAIRADPSTRTIPVVFYSAAYLSGQLGPQDADTEVLRVVPKDGDLSALIEAVEDALGS